MVVIALAAVLVGYRAFRLLPVDLLPDLESPTVVVSVRSGNRPPLEMEQLYGQQVEQRLFTVRGIRSITQIARTGRLLATVVFDWDADMDLALVEVQKAIAPMGANPNVDEVLVRRFDPRQSPVITLGLLDSGGDQGLAELRRIARRRLAPALERIEGVAEARVLGGREREVRIDVDPVVLDSLGLSLDQLAARLRAANVDIDAGTLEEGGRVYLVRSRQRFRSSRDVAQVVLVYPSVEQQISRPIRLGDVARVYEADRQITHLVRVDGREGVSLAVYKEAGANTVDVSRRLREALEPLAEDLPGIEVKVIVDQARVVESSIREVQRAALLGIALAVLVLAVFLRAAGPTVVVAAVIPVSLFATLFVMHLAHRSLNVMTLAGLALGAGMLVDNAIVVVEAIYRKLDAGFDRLAAIVEGTAEVAGAIGASTLTTCIVFLPVLFVRGLAARLVEGLSLAVIAALLLSLLAAVFLIPALAAWLLPRQRVRALDPGRRSVEALTGRVLSHPWLVLGVALLAVGVAGWGLSGLGSELLPPTDPSSFSLRVTASPGTRVEATAEVAAQVEQILTEAGGGTVRAILSEVGRLPEDDRQVREEQFEENTARITVSLSGQGLGAREVVAAARDAIASLAGLSVEWEMGGSTLARALGHSGAPLAIEIRGRSLADLREAAKSLRRRAAARGELWNVRSSLEGGPPEVRVVIDRSSADALGVSPQLVARSLQAALEGFDVTRLVRGDEEVEVTLHTPRIRRDQLERLPLLTETGMRIALGDVAHFEEVEGAREILRRNQRRVARVTARIAPGATYPQAVAALEAVAADFDLPPGLQLALAGEEEERSAALGELLGALAMALVLVLMVLAGKFESLLHPFTVLASVPLALVGVAVILVPLGWPLGVMALLGLILLAGVAVNDAILLVDTAERLRGIEGLDAAAAVARAAGIRWRPILMTTLTTVLALTPLAFGWDEAARLRAPLALTVIGGLLASTLASLFVIPSLYLLLHRLRQWRPGR